MKRVVNCVTAIVAIVLFAGCGGGGASTSTYSFDTSKRAAITPANAPAVVSSVIGGTTSDSSAIGNGLLDYSGASNRVKSRGISEPIAAIIELSKVSKRGVEIKKDAQIEKRESRKANCSGGGTVTVSSDNSTHAAIEYNSCSQNGFLLNGKIDITATSSKTTMVLSNLTIRSSNFNAAYYSAKLVVNGNSSGYSSIDYDMTAQITLSSIAGGEAETYKFQSFKLKMDGLDYGSDSTSFEIYGDMSTPCSNGWVNVDTTQKIVKVKSDQCPSSGIVKITGEGGSEVTWSAAVDGSVTIDIDGNSTTYDTCMDVPNGCGTY